MNYLSGSLVYRLTTLVYSSEVCVSLSVILTSVLVVVVVGIRCKTS
jgi:hypothetical protein